jgi:hypothetical protein
MTNAKFTRLLQRCADAAERHHRLGSEVAQECLRRYGATAGDLDVDEIIDVLDLFGGEITAEEVDEAMDRARRLSAAAPTPAHPATPNPSP